MKKTPILFSVLALVSLCSKGQTYRVFNAETQNFPIMRAHIWVTDSSTQSSKLSKNQIQIFENNEQKTPIEFKAPSSSIIPTSIVLVLDVSGSMVGYRFDVLKQTVGIFLQNLPMESTEVALTTFSDNLYLLNDFTHNPLKIIESLSKIFPEGGTHFNNAFFGEFAGALDIAKSGKNKRIVIFLTDGLSKADYRNITQKAIHDSVQINCLTIGLPINEELIYISKETSGNYFSNLNTVADIQNAFESVFFDVQENTYGYVTWKANSSCQAEKMTRIVIDNQTFHLKYTIPKNRVGIIEIAPASVIFETGFPNITQFKPVYVKGNNIDLQIRNISNTNEPTFSFQASNFPISTSANQWKTINLTFTPKDSIFSLATYKIETTDCPDQLIYASSSGIKKLQIVEPVKNDVFTSGSDFKVTWKGIDASTPVDLLYQQEGALKWNYLVTGNHFNQIVEAPPLDANIRILGQISNNISLPNLLNQPNTIFGESTFLCAHYNDAGTEVLTQTEQGTVQTWNSKNGAAINTFERPTPGKVAYSNKFNRVAVVTENLIVLFTNRNGMFIKEVPITNRKMLTSFLFIDGKEFYTSALSPFSNNFWDVTFNFRTNNLPGGINHDASMTPDGAYIASLNTHKITVFKIKENEKWMTIPISQQFQKSILHSSGNYLLADQGTGCELFQFDTKQLLVALPNQSFLQFDPSGNYLLTNNSDSILITELATGKQNYSIPITKRFFFTNNGGYLAYIFNDSLQIIDLQQQKNCFNRKVIDFCHFKFYPISNRAVLITHDSLMVFDYVKKTTLEKVNAENRLIKHIDISPDEMNLLITTPKLVSVWFPGGNTDSDTSAYFRIFSPLPKVVPSLVFNPQWVHEPTEKVFYNAIGNDTKFPIIIDSLSVKDLNNQFELVSELKKFQISPGDEINIELRCTPKFIGEISAVLMVYSGHHHLQISIKSMGIEKSYELITKQLDFGKLLVGTEADSLIPVLRNTGNIAFTVKKLKIIPENSAFLLVKNKQTITLNPGDTLWLPFRYAANTRGKQTGALKLGIDQSNEFTACEFSGTGLAKRELVIAGKTIHSQTHQPIQALVICTELNSKRIITQVRTTANGTFAFLANTDLNYSLTAQNEGYFSSGENMDLRQNQWADTLWCEIFLTPIANNSKVILNNIFFEFGKSDLLEISQTELNRLTLLLQLNKNLFIQVHGHTDDIGTHDENLTLSKDRAIAVKKYLESKSIDSHRIELKYFGETQPIATNETDEGRKTNRRVEVVFMNVKQ